MSDALRLRLAISETIELHKWRVAHARREMDYHREAAERCEADLRMYLRLQADALESIKPTK